MTNDSHSPRLWPAVWKAVACSAVAAGLIGVSASSGHAATPNPIQGGCPALLVLGVQGTSESSPTADAYADSGMLGRMFVPMLASGVSIQRAYVPYPASFGGAIGTGSGVVPFAESVAAGRANLDQMATTALRQCPHTRLAVAGFSGGAAVAASFAAQVGAAQGPVPAESVAGVALISNPSRHAGAGPLPGRPGQVTPSPAPGTSGKATSHIQLPPVPPSGGIADVGAGYGALSGRVGEFCVPGDLSCDAPGNAAALRTAAGIAAQADLRDPVAALGSLAVVLSQTFGEARAVVVLHDIHIDNGQVNYRPVKSASQRLAEAADPRTPALSPEQVQAAAAKEGRIAAAIAADPLTQLSRLLGQIGAALPQIVGDNADLLNPSVLAHYGNLVASHIGYATEGQAQHAARWFAALSHDIGGSR